MVEKDPTIALLHRIEKIPVDTTITTEHPHRVTLVKNLYNVLNIESNATHADITSSWRTLVRQLHPDKAKTEELAKRLKSAFEDITVAKEILSDGEARRNYDKENEHRIKKSNEPTLLSFEISEPVQEFSKDVWHAIRQKAVDAAAATTLASLAVVPKLATQAYAYYTVKYNIYINYNV
jgi:curved DNA-binding protein CbpA